MIFSFLLQMNADCKYFAAITTPHINICEMAIAVNKTISSPDFSYRFSCKHTQFRQK